MELENEVYAAPSHRDCVCKIQEITTNCSECMAAQNVY